MIQCMLHMSDRFYLQTFSTNKLFKWLFSTQKFWFIQSTTGSKTACLPKGVHKH